MAGRGCVRGVCSWRYPQAIARHCARVSRGCSDFLAGASDAHHVRPVRSVWLCVAGFVVAPSSTAAQLSARTDVSVEGRYVWHGISRAAGLVAQPSLALGLRVHRVSLEGGAVLHYELDAATAGELSETGAGGRHLGEADLWGRAMFVLGPTR